MKVTEENFEGFVENFFEMMNELRPYRTVILDAEATCIMNGYKNKMKGNRTGYKLYDAVCCKCFDIPALVENLTNASAESDEYDWLYLDGELNCDNSLIFETLVEMVHPDSADYDEEFFSRVSDEFHGYVSAHVIASLGTQPISSKEQALVYRYSSLTEHRRAAFKFENSLSDTGHRIPSSLRPTTIALTV